MTTEIETASPQEFLALPYQAGGIRFLLANPYSGLIMRPGLGKTACVLAVRVVLKKRKLGKRCLVVAPLRVAQLVWAAEAAKWGFPLAIGFAHGTKFETTIKDKTLDIVTMTPEGWVRLRQTFTVRDIQKLFDSLVVDESTKFKHVSSVRSGAQREYLSAFSRRTILTGTPAPNGYMDLFGQVFIVDRGHRLGKWVTQYAREYFIDIGLGFAKQILQDGAAEKIHEKLQDCLYFVDDEALGLQPYRPNPIYVELPPKVRDIYNDFKKEAIVEVQGKTVVAVNAAVLSNKLRQVANGGVYLPSKSEDGVQDRLQLHDEKTQAVVDLLEQMQGNPLLVAYEFDHDLERLHKALGDDTPTIKGGMTQRAVKKILDAFDTGQMPVLLTQMSTVSHGLNLQKHCHTICVHSIPWDWELLDQYIKRVHRMGQRKHVIVHFLIAKGTVDEIVMRALEGKDRTQRGLLRALVEYLRESGNDWRDNGVVATEDRPLGRLGGNTTANHQRSKSHRAIKDSANTVQRRSRVAHQVSATARKIKRRIPKTRAPKRR